MTRRRTLLAPQDVVRHRVGRYLEWRLQLTIESETFCTPSQPVGEGACAVNLGWRRIFDDEGELIGLRGGYIVDEQGHERGIMVPEKLWRGVISVDKLASTRDHELDVVRDMLAGYLHEMGDRAPAWLVEATQGLRQWRAPRKMQGLVDRWRREALRPPEDGVIVTRLEAWARHDRHLHRWQETQRDRIYAHRKETWRVIAADLANRYATIIVEERSIPRSMAGSSRPPRTVIRVMGGRSAGCSACPRRASCAKQSSSLLPSAAPGRSSARLGASHRTARGAITRMNSMPQRRSRTAAEAAVACGTRTRTRPAIS